MKDFTEVKHQYIIIGDRTINCAMCIDFEEEKEMAKLIKNDKLMHRKGYIEYSTLTVWVYMNQKPRINVNSLPYFWINDDGKIERSHPDKKVLEQASINNVISRSFDMIVQNTSEEGSVIGKKLKDVVVGSSNMTLPIIKRNDDFLKRAVKAIIRKKKLSLNNLPVSRQPHLAANMRSALVNDTKTSTKYFTQWSDLLSFDYYVVAVYNGMDDYPFTEPVVIKSTKGDMVSYMQESDVKSFLEIMGRASDDSWVSALSKRNDDDTPEESFEVIETGQEDEDIDID